jgi:zinc/manganese transport system permease protein
MSWELLSDPLFRIPFGAGLILALLLPLLGAMLRLRDEWLAALGLAHLAGAGALLGLAAGFPALAGAAAGAVIGAFVKSFGRFRGNTVYALMLLAGWSATLLVAANTVLGSTMGHALVEGQLYFATTQHLTAALGLALLAAVALPRIMPRLIRARLFPGHEEGNRLPAWRWHLGFDLLTALGLAVGTATLGLMGAFALVFVPPWVAFRLAGSWRSCLAISAALGVFAYGTAFATALVLDQPFGPVLVAISIGIGLLSLIRARNDR